MNFICFLFLFITHGYTYTCSLAHLLFLFLQAKVGDASNMRSLFITFILGKFIASIGTSIELDLSLKFYFMLLFVFMAKLSLCEYCF